MRLFERLVEALQKDPVKNYGGTLSVDGHISKAGAWSNNYLKAELLSHIEDTHLFVISMSAIFPVDTGIVAENLGSHTAIRRLDENLDRDVAPPFQTCWFQFPEVKYDAWSGLFDKVTDEMIFGMFLHEIEPHHYLFAFVMSDKNDPTLHRFRYGQASNVLNHEIWDSICIWLQPFSKNSTVGTMKSPSRIKFRDPKTGEKRTHKIRKVVTVFPKKMSEDDFTYAESEGVDFSHRFSVRGHWRKVAGIGKNRQDEYCVQGFTYVCEHEKGPEHLPVINKTRVVIGKED
jgi:hypothetical protein